MKRLFNKIRLGYKPKTMGLPTELEESLDWIIIDFSNHTVIESIKGEKQDSLWPYSEIRKTHINGIYKLSVSNKGYCNDWNFKPKGKERLIVCYYIYKDNIIKFIRGIISIVASHFG